MLRLSDGREWLSGMDRRLALRARLSEIDRWLASRMSLDHTDEQGRSWVAQAAHWRFEARRVLLGRERLQLQVQGPESGNWLSPGNRVPCPEVTQALMEKDVAARLYDESVTMARHDLVLGGLARRIGAWAAEEQGERQRALTLVRD